MKFLRDSDGNITGVFHFNAALADSSIQLSDSQRGGSHVHATPSRTKVHGDTNDRTFSARFSGFTRFDAFPGSGSERHRQ